MAEFPSGDDAHAHLQRAIGPRGDGFSATVLSHARPLG